MLKITQIYDGPEDHIPSDQEIITRLQQIYEESQSEVSLSSGDRMSPKRDFSDVNVRRIDGAADEISRRARIISAVLDEARFEFPEYLTAGHLQQVLSMELSELGLG